MKTIYKVFCCLAVVGTLTGCPICSTGGIPWNISVQSSDSVQIILPSFYNTTKQHSIHIHHTSRITRPTTSTPIGILGDLHINAIYHFSKNCGRNSVGAEYTRVEHAITIKRITHNAPIKIISAGYLDSPLMQGCWVEGDETSRNEEFNNIVQYCGIENLIVMPVDMDELRVVVYTPRK